ncbi:MAG: hypothetical protein M3126_10285 [Candidatus Eremiobacteraeota bacterium]|nr:hypothetical protein [Candidatus Eremiobacteraeota bacterium]
MTFRFAGYTATMVATLALGCLAPVAAATVTGSLAHPAVVWISQPAPNKTAEVEMRNRDRQFIPNLVVIAPGDSVRFPNDDAFYHSIYSYTNEGPFDIGYYGTGPGKVVKFSVAAIIDVRCHIHPSMHATIVVADGPATRGSVTSFSIDGITAGKHILHYWSDGEPVRSIEITVTGQRLDAGRIKDRR